MVVERNREARRVSMAANNGVSRRRPRRITPRDSPEEEKRMELQEKVSLRERAVKRKDRERDVFNRYRRKRGYRSNDREEGEESAGNSFDDGEDCDHETTSFPLFNLNNRRICGPANVGKRSPVWKVTEEVIGVPVPRKARSACIKRSPSNSPASEVNFPSCSNVSMKPIEPKNRPPKFAKGSISIHDDIEMEIAEVLYGLKQQSQSTKKQETGGNSVKQLDLKATGSKRRIAEAKENSAAIKVEVELIAKMEMSSGKSENISECKGELCGFVSDLGASQPTPLSMEAHNEADAAAAFLSESARPSTEDGIAAKEKPSLWPKLDVDLADSLATEGYSIASAVQSQREEKIEIDLMAPPPPEMDGSTDLVLDTEVIPQDAEMKMEIVVKKDEKVEKVVKKEVMEEGFGEKNMKITGEKHDLVRFYLDKHDLKSGSKLQQAQIRHLPTPETAISKEEKPAQNSSLPLPITIPGWPGRLPSLGYVPPVQTVVPMNGTSGSSVAMQRLQFVPLQPRPKRCATHHYVAHNIYHHQQLTKMNQFWPAAAGSGSLYGAKPYNLNGIPPAKNMILEYPSQVSFSDGNLIAKSSVVTIPGHVGKEKSSEVTNVIETAKRKSSVLQQSLRPVPAGNYLGPAFIFPVNQHQSAVAATSNQSGTSKSASSFNNASSTNSAAGAPSSPSTLPAVAAAMGFNYPNLPGSEVPYMAILQNSGYSYPIAANVGTQLAFKGGTHAQAMPFFTGSFYSYPQIPQQHPQASTHPAHQDTSTSSGSSSSQKQPQNQLVTGNNFLSSANQQLQQAQKRYVGSSHSARKHEAQMGDSTLQVTDSRALHSQKNVYGPNFAVPVQHLNFALMPSATLGAGKHGEKRQKQSQAPFAMSYTSFNGGATPAGINLSSPAQNPAILQSISDMGRHEFLVPPAAQVLQHKTYQISEVKVDGDATTADDGRKATGQSFAFSKTAYTDSPASTVMGNTVFESSAKPLNFTSSPASGIHPCPVTSTSITSTAVNSLNSQKQHSIRFQMMQQQVQQQDAIAARIKAPATNSQLSSSIASSSPSSASVPSQTLIQGDTTAQSFLWKNSSRTSAPQSPSPSLSACTTSAPKNLPQQLSAALHGHPQISFRGNLKQIISVSNCSASIVSESLSNPSVSESTGGSGRKASCGNKAGSAIPTMQSQKTENSSASPSQKSSPVCGKNVPSMLSTFPSQLSELKY